MKQWEVMHLDEKGNVDENETIYQFTAHNPMHKVNTAIKCHKNALPHGYAFIQWENKRRYDYSNYTKVNKHNKIIK